MYQICYITAAAKPTEKKCKRVILIILQLEIYQIEFEFQFLPEKKLFSTKEYKAENVPAWYDYCLNKGLQDIKFLAPVAVKDRNILGFSNTTQSSIVCFL